MAGSRAAVSATLAALALSASAALGCDGTTSSRRGGEGDRKKPDTEAGGAGLDVVDAAMRRQLLRNLADRVFVPLYADFLADSKALVGALEAHAKDPAGAAVRDAARDAWWEAMRRWQHAETLQVGPAAPAADGYPGGQAIGDEIYAWPQNNPCLVDQELERKRYGDTAALREEVFLNARGLFAIEYLLFDLDDESACPSAAMVISSGAWDALVAGDLAQRRADYALAAARDVRRRAAQLHDAWTGGFADALATAGEGSDVFETTQAGLNAVTDALFYLDTETKDMKLALPAGLHLDCARERCPDEVELLYARRSRGAVVENLKAFGAVWNGQGGEGELQGLADLVRALGAAKLAGDIDAALAASLGKTRALKPTLYEAAESPAGELDQAYAAVQELTTLLKTDLLATLALERPMRAAADND